jgi:transcription elongation factor
MSAYPGDLTYLRRAGGLEFITYTLTVEFDAGTTPPLSACTLSNNAHLFSASAVVSGAVTTTSWVHPPIVVASDQLVVKFETLTASVLGAHAIFFNATSIHCNSGNVFLNEEYSQFEHVVVKAPVRIAQILSRRFRGPLQAVLSSMPNAVLSNIIRCSVYFSTHICEAWRGQCHNYTEQHRFWDWGHCSCAT